MSRDENRLTMALTFFQEDKAFILAMGYDKLEYGVLSEFYRLNNIIEKELHISPQYEEAPAYYIGKMLEENPRYAATYIDVAVGYEKFAQQGNLYAKGRLACMYYCSFDVKLRERAELYAKEAAEAGYVPSMYLYGIITSDRYWLDEAFRLGYIYAKHKLGEWYYEGLNGITKNVSRAKEIWRKLGVQHAKCDYINHMVLYENESVDTYMSFLHKDLDASEGFVYYDLYKTLGALYFAKDYKSVAYDFFKKAFGCGSYVTRYIIYLYDLGFKGMESREYWEEKDKELMGAIKKHRLISQALDKARREQAEREKRLNKEFQSSYLPPSLPSSPPPAYTLRSLVYDFVLGCVYIAVIVLAIWLIIKYFF